MLVPGTAEGFLVTIGAQRALDGARLSGYITFPSRRNEAYSCC